MLLAGISDGMLDTYLADGPFVPLTEQTIVEPDALRAELERVRMLGYAIDEREIYDDLRCVSVPVHNTRGAVVAALSLAGSTSVLTVDRVEEFAALLREQAGQLVRKLFPHASITPRLPN